VNKPKRHKKITLPLVQIVVVSFLLTVFNNTYSQEEAQQPPRLVTSFHFSMLTGGIIIVDALLDDYPDTLHFVLDTGSGGISLDSTTAASLNLPLTLSDRTIKGIAGIRKVSFVTNRTLKLPGLPVEHLNFHVTDYDLLTSVYGIKIDGIIGYSFLKRYIVKIDYEKNVIEVWHPGKIKYPRGGYLIKPTITSIPVFDARIRDGSSRGGSFYFDTGAGLCLLISEDYERDSSILKKKNKKITYTQVEGLGGKKPLKITTVAEVKVGPYRFRKVPAYIFKDDYNVTSYPLLGGLIGNDLLRRFNLIINYDENEIHLLPNSHYAEQFDYSYTGLGIYMVNGQIVIEDVIEGSPGDIAGLKPGDVIFAINNSFNKGIQEYKSMLQTVGARLKIIVLRDGEAVVRNLKVKSIL
jgi:predicted aspartyl protease